MIGNMTRKALLVGINKYANAPLKGCEEDAKGMGALLSHHWDDSRNFHPVVLTTCDANVSLRVLQRDIQELLNGDPDMALFYFSGHGYLRTDAGQMGYLVPQDAHDSNSELLSMEWLARQVNNSIVKQVILILDCCHSGQIGNKNSEGEMSQLRQGVTLLTASRPRELAKETEEGGIFTRILRQGLDGAASDLLGHVTAAGLYNHADMLMNPWQQRPMFKCHLTQMALLRKCKPKVSPGDLRQLPSLFPHPDTPRPLTPEYEETSQQPNAIKVEMFRSLRALERVGLVRCVTEPAMYWEAMRSGACQLTEQGKLFWQLAKNGEF